MGPWWVTRKRSYRAPGIGSRSRAFARPARIATKKPNTTWVTERFWTGASMASRARFPKCGGTEILPRWEGRGRTRSEEHTSELQSRLHLVCLLLLLKKI